MFGYWAFVLVDGVTIAAQSSILQCRVRCEERDELSHLTSDAACDVGSSGPAESHVKKHVR